MVKLLHVFVATLAGASEPSNTTTERVIESKSDEPARRVEKLVSLCVARAASSQKWSCPCVLLLWKGRRHEKAREEACSHPDEKPQLARQRYVPDEIRTWG